jgi:hypothetical protein
MQKKKRVTHTGVIAHSALPFGKVDGGVVVILRTISGRIRLKVSSLISSGRVRLLARVESRAMAVLVAAVTPKTTPVADNGTAESAKVVCPEATKACDALALAWVLACFDSCAAWPDAVCAMLVEHTPQISNRATLRIYPFMYLSPILKRSHFSPV